ncbi:MAG: PAS domain S-box protein [Deltaproteobacteria bacterium]|nr:PAS domain S-box protein [Deltaproteobacteria bacterium]
MRGRFLGSFAFRIVAPVLVAGLIASGGIYLVVRDLLDRFTTVRVRAELETAVGDLHALCEDRYQELIRTGLLEDERRERIQRSRTLVAIEDFLRDRRLGGAVLERSGTEVLESVRMPASPRSLAAQVEPGKTWFATWGDRRHAVVSFSYEPWNWQLLLTKDLADYASLEKEFRAIHLAATLALAAGVALLGFLLGAFVRRHLASVVEPIRRGAAPEYRGVREFEFLSDSVGAMMRSERERIEALAEAQRIARLGNWTWDPVTGRVFWSDELYRIFGLEPRSDADGPRPPAFWDAVHPDDRERLRQGLGRCLRGREPLDLEFRLLAGDGGERVLHTKAETTADSGGRVSRMAGTVHDVTEARQAERALRASEERFRILAETSQAGIWQLSTDGRTLYANPAMCAVLGVERAEELIGADWREFFAPPDRERVEAEDAARAQGRSSNYEVRVVGRDGTERCVLVSGAPVTDPEGRLLCTIGTFLDVTDQRRAERERQRFEEQVRQAQRLESIGVLAGGIAHDLNNTLAPIIGYTELSLAAVAEGSKLREHLQQVLLAAGRARDLIRRILVFSRGSQEETVGVEVEPIMREAVAFLRASLPSTIAIRTCLRSTGDRVLASASRLHQVLMNLCTNAAQAMEPEGGLLEIGAERVEASNAGGTAGSLCLWVRDTGGGIPAEVRERMYEPFFTTKEVGQGSGMGLAIVHGIVKKLGGTIDVESTLGEGTTFRVTLPLSDEPVQAAPPPARPVPPPAGTGRILFVDDEPMLTALWTHALCAHGYDVTAARSGAEALALFEAAPDRFDVVVTDQTMPGMTGEALARRLLALRPDLPLILCTGYSPTATPARARSLGIRGFLMKPCNIEEMLATVGQVLRGTLASAPPPG